MANSEGGPYPHLPGTLRKRLDGWVRTKDTQRLTSDEARDEIIRALAGFRTNLDLEALIDVINFLTLRAAFMSFEPGRTEMDLGRRVEKHLEEMFAVPPDSADGQQYIRQLPAVVDAALTGLRRLAGTDAAPRPAGAQHKGDTMSTDASPSSRTKDVERLVGELLASPSARETGEIAIRHAGWYDSSFFAALDAFIARERAKPGGGLAPRLEVLPGYLQMVKKQADGGKIQRMEDDLAIGEAMERIRQMEQAVPAGDDRTALDEAVARHRELVQITPAGYHDRGVFLSNLAGALMQRFERFGAVGDLDEAISLVRTAMQAAPLGSAARADFLANLHVALMRKYEHTQAPGDRDQAIDAARLATRATPDGHPLRAIRLGGLGTALLRRYDQTHAAEDADEAVGVLRAALKVIPAGDAEHDKIASLLSVALLERSSRGRRA